MSTINFRRVQQEMFAETDPGSMFVRLITGASTQLPSTPGLVMLICVESQTKYGGKFSMPLPLNYRTAPVTMWEWDTHQFYHWLNKVSSYCPSMLRPARVKNGQHHSPYTLQFRSFPPRRPLTAELVAEADKHCQDLILSLVTLLPNVSALPKRPEMAEDLIA